MPETQKQPDIPCSHCKGRGIVPLPTHLFHTLQDVGSVYEPTTRELVQIAARERKEQVALAAMCNRLRELERLGLIVRQRTTHPTGGVQYVYAVAPEVQL